jgi:hypothetical protein
MTSPTIKWIIAFDDSSVGMAWARREQATRRRGQVV